MRKTLIAIATMAALVSSAEARPHRYHHQALDANGNSGIVISHKTGAKARVGAAYATKFQAYIDDLEANGARVLFIGGIRRGRCSSGHMHPCGRALDVCQRSRGRVDSRCHLPDRTTIAAIAERHGLFEGGQWCNQDYGHAQAGVSAPACGTTMMAKSHHRHHRNRRIQQDQPTFQIAERPTYY